MEIGAKYSMLLISLAPVLALASTAPSGPIGFLLKWLFSLDAGSLDAPVACSSGVAAPRVWKFLALVLSADKEAASTLEVSLEAEGKEEAGYFTKFLRITGNIEELSFNIV